MDHTTTPKNNADYKPSLLPKPANFVSSLQELLALVASGKRVVVSDAEYLNETISVSRPSEDHWKEVVQIGAVEIVGGKLGARFCSYCAPGPQSDSLTQTQWDSFEEITAIPKKTVTECENSYADVWLSFVEFCGKDPIVVIAGDREVHKWTHALAGKAIDEEINGMPWVILRPLLPPNLAHLCSGELYKMVGLSEKDVLEGSSTHNALFDAISMALFLTLYTP
jgi:hypothetical protein